MQLTWIIYIGCHFIWKIITSAYREASGSKIWNLLDDGGIGLALKALVRLKSDGQGASSFAA